MKKLILTMVFLLVANVGWCATRTISDAGGNWNATTAWAEGSVPVNGDDVVATGTSGNLVVNANSANLKSFDLTNYVGTMSGTSSITVVGAASTTVAVKFAGTITWTGTLNLNPESSTSCVIQLTTNAKALANVSIAGTSGGSVTLQDNLTFQAAKTHTLTLSNNNLTMAATTISGNSATNRILIASNTLGTARTITISGGTFANADFRDITLSSATDLSAITGGSGNCEGNTGITFTTADDWYWNGSGTQNLSDYTYWYTATNGGGSQMASTRTVLPQDTLYFDADSIDGATTVDQDLPRIPGIDFTGVSAMAFHMNNIHQEIYGSLTLVSNVTLTFAGNSLTFASRGTNSITSAGKSFQGGSDTGSFQVSMVGGTLNILDNFVCRFLYLNYGTIDASANDPDITMILFTSSNSNTRSIVMGDGTWTLGSDGSGSYANMWTTTTATNYSVTPGASTLVFSTISQARAYNMVTSGKTYNNVTISARTNAGASFTFVNTGTAGAFNVMTLNAPNGVYFTSGTTLNVNSFVIGNDGTNEVTLSSSTADSIATISDANGGTNVNDYLNVVDITATQENTFYYGANGSADNATNWAAAPSAGGRTRRFFIVQ